MVALDTTVMINHVRSGLRALEQMPALDCRGACQRHDGCYVNVSFASTSAPTLTIAPAGGRQQCYRQASSRSRY